MRSVALVLVLCGCIDTTLEGVKSDAEEGVRELEVEPRIIDFGTVASAAPVTGVITLTSVGDLPVAVSTIDISGSPAYSITWASADLVLQPGDSAEVIVTYAPASFEDEGQVVVRSDAVESDQGVQLLGAGLYPGIEITPYSLYFESEYGESAYEDFIVYSIGTTDLELSDMVVQGPQFVAEGGIPTVLAPGETTTVRVTYTPEGEGETASGKVWLTTNTPIGYAIVPLEAREGRPCIGLGEAWDRGLLYGHTEADGGTFGLESLATDDEICIDHWYVWVSTESQDLGAGDMDADFGGIYPAGSLNLLPGEYLQFDGAGPTGEAWYCVEQEQYTRPSRDYVFLGARVPEPLLTYMLAEDQEASWAWQDEHPVMIAARGTNFIGMPGGGGTAPVTIRALNMGSRSGYVELHEAVPAGYTAAGFSVEPIRTETGADQATIYVFDAQLYGWQLQGSSEQVLYDELAITYTLGIPPCRGRQYLPPMETHWEDADGIARTATANPLVINCE
ncbi:MAG: choice-of-anchor D domain-containing protein [Pseudomonadota bacterium]|nr:choice-of-anchor D domain-containing protein [Pseudomonadota bacterium]